MSVEKDRYLDILGRTAEKHRLLSVLWELTYRCNTRCVHCYLVKPEGGMGRIAAQRELRYEECITVLDQLAELGVLNLAFTGGEIFLRSDLFDIVREARRRRFSVRLKTNGTLLTPEAADRIADLYVVSVDISLYGARPETHDGITLAPGSFKRVVRAFRLLNERGVRTRALTPLMEANVKELGEIRDLARELGADFSYDPTLTVMHNGCDLPLRYGLSDESLLALWRGELKAAPGGSDNGRYDGPLCTAGMNRLCVGPYGDVYPCEELRLSVGNVQEQTLSDLWHNSPMLDMLRQLCWRDFEQCCRCGLRDLCSPCMGQAWLEHGELLRPSGVVCRQTRLRGRALETVSLEAGE